MVKVTTDRCMEPLGSLINHDNEAEQDISTLKSKDRVGLHNSGCNKCTCFHGATAGKLHIDNNTVLTSTNRKKTPQSICEISLSQHWPTQPENLNAHEEA